MTQIKYFVRIKCHSNHFKLFLVTIILCTNNLIRIPIKYTRKKDYVYAKKRKLKSVQRKH